MSKHPGVQHEIDFSKLTGLYCSTDHNSPGTNGPMSAWIASQFPEGYQGYCVDVGASDGFNVNSTFVLEKIYLWHVISIEANPYFHKALNHNRVFCELCAVSDRPRESAPFYVNATNLEAGSSLSPSRHSRVRECDHGSWGRIDVRVTTVDLILQKWQWTRLDALCIDVEGGEADVISGANLDRWKPKVVVAESWDEGQLDRSLPGYERVWRQGDNDCYLLLG